MEDRLIKNRKSLQILFLFIEISIEIEEKFYRFSNRKSYIIISLN